MAVPYQFVYRHPVVRAALPSGVIPMIDNLTCLLPHTLSVYVTAVPLGTLTDNRSSSPTFPHIPGLIMPRRASTLDTDIVMMSEFVTNGHMYVYSMYS